MLKGGPVELSQRLRPGLRRAAAGALAIGTAAALYFSYRSDGREASSASAGATVSSGLRTDTELHAPGHRGGPGAALEGLLKPVPEFLEEAPSGETAGAEATPSSSLSRRQAIVVVAEHLRYSPATTLTLLKLEEIYERLRASAPADSPDDPDATYRYKRSVRIARSVAQSKLFGSEEEFWQFHHCLSRAENDPEDLKRYPTDLKTIKRIDSDPAAIRYPTPPIPPEISVHFDEVLAEAAKMIPAGDP